MSRRDHEAELHQLLNALAESVVEATDEELLDEAANVARDPKQTAQAVKGTLFRALNDVTSRRREEKRQAWLSRSQVVQKKNYNLPESEEERRLLLTDVLAGNPEMAHQLTIAHRDLQQWDDADILSALRQAIELGLLVNEKPSESE